MYSRHSITDGLTRLGLDQLTTATSRHQGWCCLPPTTVDIYLSIYLLYLTHLSVLVASNACMQAREVSQVTGEDVMIVDAAPHIPGLQVLLRPGEGKLFVVRATATNYSS